jgi:Tol biopolymer transport system component
MSLASLSASASPLTGKGMVVGTFQYMAPEVLQGAEADAHSDIFSFGCVLYEMITGRRAFEGKSQFSVLGAILDKEPERVSALQPSAPARLDETVRRCLAKSPDERYGCIHDVSIQLKAVSESAPPEVIASEPSSRRARRGWVAAGVATLAALVLAGVYLNLALHPSPVVRSYILPPTGTVFVTMVPASGPPVLSPDGTQLAFTARDDKGKVMLYVRPLTSLTPQRLTGTEDAMYPFWSPDSREIGFFAAGKLKKINASGGPPQTLCDVPNGRGGAWSKDGVIVFTPSATQPLLRVSAAGGTPEPASKLDISQGENSHRWPAFLPDGKHFLYWARNSRGTQEHVLYVGVLGSLQAKPLMKSESLAVYASGYLLFMRDQTLMAQPFNPRGMELTGEPSPIAERVAINGGTNRPLFSASENGELVYQSGEASGGWNLLWIDREGKQNGSVPQADRYFYPALSPDDTRLAANIVGTQGTGDIWIFDLKRGTNTRLTFGPALQSSPTWTPDGKTIFYSSTDKGPPHIYAKAADGSGSERIVLESNDTAEFPESFSPDGRYLVYDRRDLGKSQTGYDLWVLPLFGDGKPFPIVQTAFDDAESAVSPDGKWMAYQNNESGRMEVYITAFPGGGAKWEVSSNGGIAAKWRRDGKELFFLDSADNLMAVDVNTSNNAVRLGVPHVLFQALSVQRQAGPYDVTADGKKFLINSGNVKEGNEPMTLVLNWTAELKK